MLKLSRDKTKLKRRVPYKVESLNQNEIDKNMVYCENFPESISHE